MTKIMARHHKTRVANCKGRMRGERSEYGVWAYWCPEAQKSTKTSGWTAQPCTCAKKAASDA